MTPNLFLLNLSRNNFQGEIPDLVMCDQLNYLNLTGNPKLRGTRTLKKPAKALEGEATKEYIGLMKRRTFFEFFALGMKVAVKRLSSQQGSSSQGVGPPPVPLFRFLVER